MNLMKKKSKKIVFLRFSVTTFAYSVCMLIPIWVLLFAKFELEDHDCPIEKNGTRDVVYEEFDNNYWLLVSKQAI